MKTRKTSAVTVPRRARRKAVKLSISRLSRLTASLEIVTSRRPADIEAQAQLAGTEKLLRNRREALKRI